ncbi:oligosaccharide flippase family protein [Photobacterium phosphoreum]|uniref:oligosaccharide flippase family protein n=1 Tax=Photobacterium phosphoreum TaxID=659 RepID=UPI000D453274|nr:oligosaccharide flippase family protein [Photobacterium phosphoreum]PQJ91725.1 hypothetical protein BTO21_08445 [Photobacterium phosphoreum]
MNVKLYKAIVSSVIGKLAVYIVQFTLLMIYARLFSPDDFGKVASIFVFVVFFQLLSDIGIGPALINEKRISKSELNGVFTLTIIIGIITTIIFLVSSVFISDFYSDKIYQLLVLCIAPTVLFSCCSIVPYTCCLKDVLIIKINIIEAISHIISFLLIIITLDFISPIVLLALRSSIFSCVRFFILYKVSSKTSLGRAIIGFDFSIFERIWKFSSYQFGFGIINYFSRNLDNILIAKFLGPIKVGIYDQSYQLMRYPLQLTSFALSSAIQPVLSEKKSDLEYIANEHNKLIEKIVCLSLIIFSFFFFNSELIVYLILGDKWLKVIPLIEIFNYSLPFQMIMATSGAFFQSIGRVDLLFRAGLIGSIIFVISIVTSIFFYSIKATAWSVTISFILNFISIYYILFKFGFKKELKSFYLTIYKVILKFIPYIILTIFIYSVLENILDHESYFIGIISTILPIVVFMKKFLLIMKENN